MAAVLPHPPPSWPLQRRRFLSFFPLSLLCLSFGISFAISLAHFAVSWDRPGRRARRATLSRKSRKGEWTGGGGESVFIAGLRAVNA